MVNWFIALEFPSPKDDLCKILVEILAKWFWRRAWNCLKVYKQTDNRRSEKFTWAFSSCELKLFTGHLMSVKNTVLRVHKTDDPWVTLNTWICLTFGQMVIYWEYILNTSVPVFAQSHYYLHLKNFDFFYPWMFFKFGWLKMTKWFWRRDLSRFVDFCFVLLVLLPIIVFSLALFSVISIIAFNLTFFII